MDWVMGASGGLKGGRSASAVGSRAEEASVTSPPSVIKVAITPSHRADEENGRDTFM